MAHARSLVLLVRMGLVEQESLHHLRLRQQEARVKGELVGEQAERGGLPHASVDGVTVRIYVPVSMHREAGAHGGI